MDPSAQLEEVYLGILRGGERPAATAEAPADLPADPERGGARARDRLPATLVSSPLTSFVGRDEDIARVLKARMGDAGRRVPTLQLPSWLVRLAALRDPAVKQILPELGKPKNATAEKARRMLGWAPRPPEEALVASAESLVRLGLVKGPPGRSPG